MMFFKIYFKKYRIKKIKRLDLVWVTLVEQLDFYVSDSISKWAV
jgi:hypothetical protein